MIPRLKTGPRDWLRTVNLLVAEANQEWRPGPGIIGMRHAPGLNWPEIRRRVGKQRRWRAFGVGEIVTNAGDGTYTLHKQEWDGNSWEDLGSELTARDYLSRKHGHADANQLVLWWEQVQNDGTVDTLIDVTQQTSPFLVTVTEDGGVSGGAAANCTWTYTVKDVGAGTTIGTTMSPERARFANTTYTKAAAGTYGLAGYDGSTLKLLVCYDEIQGTTICP